MQPTLLMIRPVTEEQKQQEKDKLNIYTWRIHVL